MVQILKKIKPIDRFRQFLIYCKNLNDHPFVAKHKDGFTFQYTHRLAIDQSDPESTETNFDEFHLESLLTRIRQFLFKGELFYCRDVFDSVEKLLGQDQELNNFFKILDEKLNAPFESGNVQIIKVGDGKVKQLIAGRTLKELIEARLYNGAIHSERKISPEPESVFEDFSAGDKHLLQHLNWELAGACMNTVGNIWRFRNQIILAARRANKINVCPELEAVNKHAQEKGL